MAMAEQKAMILSIALVISLWPAVPTAVRCAEAGPSPRQQSYQLPDLAKPSAYHLKVEPDLTKATFKGQETIYLTVKSPTSTIVLNSAELKIARASITRSDSPAAHPIAGTLTSDSKREQVGITFANQLKPGDYELRLEFNGILNDKLRGFYRATYLDQSGHRQSLATTQMEPTDARRMFPCFDEPLYKARFQVTAVIDPGLTAISNAPVERQLTSGQKKTVVFSETPAMSSYLLALVVGRFESTDPITVAGVPIRVFALKGKKSMGRYAQEIAGRLLSYYNSYFGIPYPAKKLDLIAIPEFEAGAMENLGAITFRETALLVDDKTASTETKQGVAGIVAHEMAHMWFGDLVTMSWWDDLWLNEAFATWMGTKAIDYLMPQWHHWDQFGLARSAALTSDSLQSTRPIHFPVEDPNQANEMFDEITYSKGASVLRMLEKYVGEAVFQSGVHHYLLEHAFGNAKTEELWKAIGQASGLPIPQMMKAWVYQAGYPLVSVHLGLDGKSLNLEQSRFYLDPPAGKSTTVWPVPLSIRPVEPTGSLVNPELFSLSSQTRELSSPLKTFIANPGGNGFYRVQYSAPLYASLVPVIQSQLPASERLGLLCDQWALTVAGVSSIKDYLELTSSFRSEPDPAVMSALISQLQQLYRFVGGSSRGQFAAFVRDRLLPTKKRLGWKARAGESDLQKMLRSDVLAVLGTVGQDHETISEARSLFNQFRAKPSSVDPNLLRSITTIVAYNGGATEYALLKQYWWTAKTPETEERNLMALGLFQKPELISRSLELSLSGILRAQDSPHLLGTLVSNEAAKATTWQFIKQNWKRILARYPLNMVPHLVSTLSSMTLAEQQADLHAFFKDHPVAAGQRTVAKMLEKVKINVSFRSRNAQQLQDWLRNFH